VRLTALLLLVVAAAGVAVYLTPAPERVAPREKVRGPRVVKMRPGAVDRLTITLADRRLDARRDDGGWVVDGRPSGPALGEALDDLVEVLTGLRAVDRFRAEDDAPYGLDDSPGTLEIVGGGRPTRLVLGRMNAAGSAVYARRDDSPRVLLLGAYILSAIDRVFYQRNHERDPA
jgi:hypothetical protein